MTTNSKTNGFDENETSPQEVGSNDPISSALKQVYDEVANEPLPDKLNSLLEQLRNGDKK